MLLTGAKSQCGLAAKAGAEEITAIINKFVG
jgi:hypothetical protein